MPEDRSTTRRRVLLGVGAGVSVALAGCGAAGDTDTPTDDDGMMTGTATATPTETATATETPETASVRIGHLSPNAPNVDVYVDGSAVLEDVAFGSMSPYLEVPAGERDVEVTVAGDPNDTVNFGTLTVEAETAYTIAAVGEVGNEADLPLETLVLEDDNSDPGDDTARVRLVHASPDAPAVDVTLASNGDVLFDGPMFLDSATVEVPAGDYTLQIRGDTESNDGDVVAAYDVSVAGGEAYTAFAAGYLTPDDEPADTPFDLLLSTDTGEPGLTSAPAAETGGAQVRVAHMSPNAPNVDVYVDGSAVLEDVPFGAVSSYLEVPAGERGVEITAAGDADTVVFDGNVPVESATAYTIAAAGEIGDDAGQPFQPLVLTDDNSDPGDDSARLRVVHASPDAPAVDVTAGGGDTVLFDGVAFGESGYTTVPANDYTVEIRGDTEGNDGEVVADFDVSLDGGEVYTAFAAGYLSPDDEPVDTSFDLLVTQDS